MKHIAIFCSANDLEEKYVNPAKEFARLLAENNYHLVWGGSDTGLMKIIAAGVRAAGGRLVGVSVEFLKDKAHKTADEMIIAKTLGERKATMLLRSDAIVVLVGGMGTLDEITEIVELKKHKSHNKPIVILNTENFYAGFKLQLERMAGDGFLTCSLEDLIYFAEHPKEAIHYINECLNNEAITR